jgi:hypothetical protein
MEIGRNSLSSYEVGQTKVEELETTQSLLIESEIDQLSYAILDKKANQCVGLSVFPIDRVNKREKVKALLSSDKVLSYPFSSRSILMANRECVFIPEEIYKEEELALYVSASFADTFEGQYFSKRLPELHNYLVFKVPNWLLTDFNNYLSGATISHSTAYLAEAVYRMSTRQTELTVHAHFKKAFFELFIFDHGKMLFYNSFAYQTSEDIAYFIMYALTQWELKANSISVSGVLDEKSDELYWLRKYLKEIRLFPVDDLVAFPPAIELATSFINLLNPSLCE